MIDVSDLSPVAQDYLKVIWSATEWGDRPVTTKALAARQQTSAAAVTDMMRRLSGQGLINYLPYQPVSLTDEGARLAKEMVRRHRIIETYLVQRLGYRWDEIHDEAERLEHAVSAQLIERMDAALGHPVSDPHGDPIPGPGGELPDYRASRLSEAEPGEYEVTRVSDNDPETLAQLDARGIVPGARIGVPVDLPGDVQELVWVEERVRPPSP